MIKKNIIKLDPSLVSSRLGLCAAAMVGTAAAVPSAEAVIVTFNTAIPVPPTLAGIYINLGNGTSGPNTTVGWDFNPYQAAGGALAFYWAPGSGGVVSTATGPYLSLAPGTVVGPGSTFGANTFTSTAGSPYRTTGTFTLGFQFTNEATGATNYGYATIMTSAPNGFPATVLRWSYDNTGAPITVVPEPSAIALLTMSALAAGALGLRKWRRQEAA